MLPSVVEKDIEDGVRSFIEREFPVATPGFRSGLNFDQSMVDDFLAKRENFIKGPWLEIRRPFRKADEDMTEVLPDLSGRCGIGTEFKPYQHQLAAFKRLRMPGGKSTIVATGTGSGKTECFLYPVLDYVIRAHQEGIAKGIKAIIIYPMNALATGPVEAPGEALLEDQHQDGPPAFGRPLYRRPRGGIEGHGRGARPLHHRSQDDEGLSSGHPHHQLQDA